MKKNCYINTMLLCFSMIASRSRIYFFMSDIARLHKIRSRLRLGVDLFFGKSLNSETEFQKIIFVFVCIVKKFTDLL